MPISSHTFLINKKRCKHFSTNSMGPIITIHKSRQRYYKKQTKELQATHIFMNRYIRILNRGFPVVSVVKNLPANTTDMGSIPESEKIPHATEKLKAIATESNCSRVKGRNNWKPAYPRSMAQLATREATTIRSPCTVTRVVPAHATRKSPHSNEEPAQPNKQIKGKKKKKTLTKYCDSSNT